MDADRENAAEAVLDVLERLSMRAREKALVDRFYERFFECNPEVVPLFGPHALAEREEMMHETLNSLVACCQNEPWLEGNLRALGASHAEYGVTSDMYPAFVTAFLETIREILGEQLAPDAEKCFGRMLEQICGVMSEEGARGI